MLALRPSKQSSALCIPNVLPCRIHHNGPTKVTKRYWSPSTEKDTTRISYFRGRKLQGRTLKLPPDFMGVVVKSTDCVLQPKLDPSENTSQPIDDMDEDEDEEEGHDTEPVKILETLSNFEEVVVWGHDQLPDIDDIFVKGVEEWITLAEAIHGKSNVEATTSAPS